MNCVIFAMCDKPADGFAYCGPLGWRPSCERCAQHVGLDYVLGEDLVANHLREFPGSTIADVARALDIPGTDVWPLVIAGGRKQMIRAHSEPDGTWFLYPSPIEEPDGITWNTEQVHTPCAQCDEAVRSAIGLAQATGSRESTYNDDGNHSARVWR